jgi:hypothetical protein
VALAVTVLIGASLAMRSFLALQPTLPGFDASNKLVVQLFLDARYTAANQWRIFFADVQARIAALPGVLGVSGTADTPLSNTAIVVPVAKVDAPDRPSGAPCIYTRVVTPNYLAELATPVIAAFALVVATVSVASFLPARLGARAEPQTLLR